MSVKILLVFISFFTMIAITDPVPKIILEKDLVIGNEKDGVYFGQILNIEIDAQGLIYVADWNTNDIRIFDKDGKLTAKIGNTGRGPGDFEKVSSIGLDAEENLYVLDINLLRVNIIDTKSYEFLRIINLPPVKNKTSYASIPNRIYSFPENSDFLLRYLVPYSPGTSNLNRKQRLILFNSKGKVLVNPFLEIKEDEKLIRESEGSITIGDMPFGKKTKIYIAPDNLVYVAWTGEPVIKIFDKDAKLVNTVSLETELVPINNEDLRKKQREYSSFELTKVKKQLPESLPVFEWFVVDEQSRIWVAVNTENREFYDVHVLNYDGEIIDRVPLSKSVELKAVKNGYAYGVHQEEKGLQSIVRYKILYPN